MFTEPVLNQAVIQSVQFHIRHRYLTPMQGHALYYLYDRFQGKDSGPIQLNDMAQDLGRTTGRCRSYLKQLRRVGLINKGDVMNSTQPVTSQAGITINSIYNLTPVGEPDLDYRLYPYKDIQVQTKTTGKIDDA